MAGDDATVHARQPTAEGTTAGDAGFVGLAERKEAADAALGLAMASVVVLLVEVGIGCRQAGVLRELLEGRPTPATIQTLNERHLNLAMVQGVVRVVAVGLLVAFGSITVDARRKRPGTDKGQPDGMYGAGIAAIVVAVICLGVGGAACVYSLKNVTRGQGTNGKWSRALYDYSQLAMLAMGVVGLMFAGLTDNWTWDGARLVSKDTWDDCDAYQEDHCMTMDQWDERQ